MFFETNFSQGHVVFVISDEGEHDRHAHHVHRISVSEKEHALVIRLLSQAIFAIFCEISSEISSTA